jgi:hypothetical protein
MRRKADYPLEKVTLNLRDGDFERLQILHGRIGAGKVIRQLVISHLKRVDDRVAKVAPTEGEVE